MPQKSKLKVFRMAISLHDADVAAPSHKPALQAWGHDDDLFTSKMAALPSAVPQAATSAEHNALARRQAELDRERRALETDHRTKSDKGARLNKARAAYDVAMRKGRGQ